MSPAASCNSKATETRETNGVAVPTLQEKNLKRKLRDLKDVTEEGDFSNCRGEKQSRPTVVAKEKTMDEVVNDDELSTQFEDIHASDGHRARQKMKPTNAQSTQRIMISTQSSLCSGVYRVANLSITLTNISITTSNTSRSV